MTECLYDSEVRRVPGRIEQVKIALKGQRLRWKTIFTGLGRGREKVGDHRAAL